MKILVLAALLFAPGILKAQGDNLGNHIATQTVSMQYGLIGSSASFNGASVTVGSSLTLRGIFKSTSAVFTSSNVIANAYEINGSTILAITDSNVLNIGGPGSTMKCNT